MTQCLFTFINAWNKANTNKYLLIQILSSISRGSRIYTRQWEKGWISVISSYFSKHLRPPGSGLQKIFQGQCFFFHPLAHRYSVGWKISLTTLMKFVFLCVCVCLCNKYTVFARRGVVLNIWWKMECGLHPNFICWLICRKDFDQCNLLPQLHHFFKLTLSHFHHFFKLKATDHMIKKNSQSLEDV